MASAVWIGITLVCLFNIGGALSNKAFLALTKEPKDTVFNTDSNREFATFYCNADGYPEPDITWLADDQIVTENKNSLYNVTKEGNLRILRPPRHLNGSTYRCIANNSFGAVLSKAAILEIAYVDISVVPLPDVSINVRLGKCISCNPSEAYPGIKATWMKNTTNTVDPNGRIRVMMDGKLCFAHSETGDTGAYSCLVSNRYDDGGATSFTRSPAFRFSVLERSGPQQSLTPAPDMQESVTVRQGQEAVLECFFLGRPTPTLAWSREGNDLPSNSTQSRDNQELRIPNAQPEDGGEYQCTGTSDGYSKTVSRRLTVLAPPLLVSGLKDEEVDPGRTVTLQCTADSDAVEFSWYHNTRLINSSMQRPRISEDNTLTIENAMVEDSGIYQCAARNEHGITLSTSQLFVQEQQDPTEENPIDPEKNQPNTESQAIDPEKNQPNSESQDNGAGYTLVHGFSTVVMVSAVLFEVILF